MSIVSEVDEKIDEYVQKQMTRTWIQKPNYYSPSGIHSCYRQQHFRKLITKPSDLKLQKKALVGEIIHKHYILPAIKAAWPDAIELKVERDITIVVDIERELYIHGRTDGLVHLKDPKFGRFVVEVKSIANLFAEREDIFDYKAQVMPYYLGLMAPKGVLIVVGRSTGQQRTYVIPYDHEIMKWVVNRVITSYDYYERKEIPPPEGMICERFRKNMKGGKIKYWACGYCRYSGECADVECSIRESEVEPGV